MDVSLQSAVAGVLTRARKRHTYVTSPTPIRAPRMKLRLLLALASLLAFSACDGTDSEDSLRDALSGDLSTLAALTDFGGISYDASTQNSYGEATLVVYTLGESPETEARIRSRLATHEHRLDRRPARGEATPALLRQLDVLAPIAPIEDIGRTAHRIEINPATGYAEIGVWTVFAASGYLRVMAEEGIPFDNVVVMVEDRPSER